MIIKKFDLFESQNFSSKFPDLEEIKSYFYDFTDETNTSIDDYDFGYLYFQPFGRVQDSDARWDGMVDILHTQMNATRLEYCAEFIRINRDYDKKINKNRISFIESGQSTAYEFLNIHFETSLFEKAKIGILEDCLKTLYSQTEFRPVKSLWTEDYVDNITGEVVTKYGFEGTFVRVSDDEYSKLCQIFTQGNLTPILTKLFR